MARKAFIIVGVLVAIGVAVGIIVAVTGGGSGKASTSSGANVPGNATDSSVASTVSPSTNVSDTSLIGLNATGSGSGSATGVPEPTSDPDTATAAFTMLAIGDWGATTDKPGSCCNKYRKTAAGSLEFKTDYWAQINVAELLAQSAAAISPVRVIGHGDNIYWNGAGPKDIDYRMHTTFEDVYSHKSLEGIPWINVVGNHDLGGSEFLCGDVDYQFRECTSIPELLDYLNKKFTLQATYKSENFDRWRLTDHYYKESVEKNGVSVDIFNVDTNFAESHGVRQVCCQCYGYVKAKGLSQADESALSSTCNNAKAGDELCAGGDVAMYDACSNTIKKWWDDSISGIKKDLAASTATWKIVNSHYSPHFHMSEDKMKEWYLITKEHNVHVWMNGHTHGFNHDISKWGTHFYENGGGGGIQSETSGHPPEVAEKFVDHAWIAAGNPYGFFELHVSKDWLKTEFVTFDDTWVFSDTKEQIVKGGTKKGHCWHVPVTGGKGRACKA